MSLTENTFAERHNTLYYRERRAKVSVPAASYKRDRIHSIYGMNELEAQKGQKVVKKRTETACHCIHSKAKGAPARKKKRRHGVDARNVTRVRGKGQGMWGRGYAMSPILFLSVLLGFVWSVRLGNIREVYQHT